MVEDSLVSAVRELQNLVTLLSQENLSRAEDSRLEELGDRLLGLLEGFPRQGDHSQMRGHFSSIHASAVTLWNLAVAFRASGNTRKCFVAQLRHVSLGLVLLSEPPSPQVSHLKKLLAMSLKTTRSWLDAGNFVMADAAIVHGWEQADRLFKCVGSEPEAAAVVSASKVRLLACKSEAWLGLSEQERALDCIGQAKQLLPHISLSERAWVSVHCYNLGLELYKSGAFGKCLSWLKESYEIGRQGHCIEAIKQARTLRVIAFAYLESDDSERDWLKSLNTVELSLTEHVHPSGLFLKFKVLLHGRQTSGGQEMQIRSALFDLIHCPDSELELSLTAVRMAADTAGLSELAFLSLSTLREFHSSTPGTNKCALLQLELLLRADRLEEAGELLSGMAEFGLEVEVSKRLVMLVWDQATRLVETGRHSQAILLYDHCIARYSSCGLGETNLAKLHRNRASCLMELGKLEEAQTAFQMALNFCPSSPYTHYIGYKLAILLDKSALAGQHLSNMISSQRSSECVSGEVSTQGLLSLAVQVAFESGNKRVACSALEQLVCMEDSTTCDTLSALRCLVRLKLTLMEAGEEGERVGAKGQVVKLLETALLHLRRKSTNGQENISMEVGWFSKVAWNMALQSHTDYSAMKQFFALSMRLNGLSPLDPSIQSRQKSCLVGASAASLKYLKNLADESEVKSVAEEVLGFVDQGKKLCGGGGGQQDSSLVFFHLFEFEAKHRLGYQNLGKCLEEIALLPASDCKIFEAIAAIASSGNTHSKRLAVKSLQLSLERLKCSDGPLDLTRQAELHHSLISILLSNELLVDAAGRENAFSTFKQILALLESCELNGKQKYPEIDAVWLMTKCWNLGVVQYSKQQFVEAERYCGLALKFLYQLNEMKPAYEATMTNVYSEILAKLPESSDCVISQQPEL